MDLKINFQKLYLQLLPHYGKVKVLICQKLNVLIYMEM